MSVSIYFASAARRIGFSAMKGALASFCTDSSNSGRLKDYNACCYEKKETVERSLIAPEFLNIKFMDMLMRYMTPLDRAENGI